MTRRRCLLILPLALVGCTKTVGHHETCDCSYEQRVRPLILSRCAVAGCHVADFPFGNFTQYLEIRDRANDGSLQAVMDYSLMPPPPKTPLSDNERRLLLRWMADGAKGY